MREATGVEVYDRPALSSRFFIGMPAPKKLDFRWSGKTQVPRPRGRVSGPRAKGWGRGARGVSESFHEIERRKVRDRTSELQRELKAVHREQVERRRHREGLPRSPSSATPTPESLQLCGAHHERSVVQPALCNPGYTVRALHPETQPGFSFPTRLVSFESPHDLVPHSGSTLDEALDASLLLHVVDAADPAFRSHIQVTTEVLEDIGAGELPSLVILNKIDIVGLRKKALLEKEFPQGIAMSALNPQDIEALHSRLVTFFSIL